MQLLIKQRVFSWTDTYDVYDENQRPKYYVKSEFLTIGHHIHVYEKKSGREVGVIHQKILTFMPKFEIEINGRIVGIIEKRFSLFRPKYEIMCNNWYVDGDYFGWSYSVKSGQNIIMNIEKKILSWGDTYVLNYSNQQDELMGLLLVIGIDAANCKD